MQRVLCTATFPQAPRGFVKISEQAVHCNFMRSCGRTMGSTRERTRELGVALLVPSPPEEIALAAAQAFRSFLPWPPSRSIWPGRRIASIYHDLIHFRSLFLHASGLGGWDPDRCDGHL